MRCPQMWCLETGEFHAFNIRSIFTHVGLADSHYKWVCIYNKWITRSYDAISWRESHDRNLYADHNTEWEALGRREFLQKNKKPPLSVPNYLYVKHITSTFLRYYRGLKSRNVQDQIPHMLNEKFWNSMKSWAYESF